MLWLIIINLLNKKKNIFNFLSLIIDKENNKINLNLEDEIVNTVVLTQDGSLRLEQFK